MQDNAVAHSRISVPIGVARSNECGLLVCAVRECAGIGGPRSADNSMTVAVRHGHREPRYASRSSTQTPVLRLATR
jgi:hypothetical protein